MRPMAALLCATAIVVGCSAPTRQTANPASPLVTAVATTSPTSSAAVTSTASPTPTAVPTSDRTPVPVIAKKLNIAWKADDPVGLPAVSSVVDVVHTDDGYVLVTERYEDEERHVRGVVVGGRPNLDPRPEVSRQSADQRTDGRWTGVRSRG